jgi:GT2 family glycosyltransferase
VIIPSYRSAATLSKCLHAVVRQQTCRLHQIVVMHSGSESLANSLRREHPQVHFFESPERRLPGVGRNWAASCSSGDWLLFLDADCIVSETWLDRMLDTAKRYRAVAVGGSVRNGTPRSPAAWAMHLLEFDEWLPGSGVEMRSNFPSCNALYRRRDFVAAGGFPEDVFPAEDTILNLKIARRGGVAVFDRAASVRHLHSCGVREMLARQHAHGRAYRTAADSYDLPPRVLARLPLALLIPAVVIGRFPRMLLRLLVRAPASALIFVVLSPLMWLGLAAWAIGYGDPSLSREMSEADRRREELSA